MITFMFAMVALTALGLVAPSLSTALGGARWAIQYRYMLLREPLSNRVDTRHRLTWRVTSTSVYTRILAVMARIRNFWHTPAQDDTMHIDQTTLARIVAAAVSSALAEVDSPDVTMVAQPSPVTMTETEQREREDLAVQALAAPALVSTPVSTPALTPASDPQVTTDPDGRVTCVVTDVIYCDVPSFRASVLPCSEIGSWAGWTSGKGNPMVAMCVGALANGHRVFRQIGIPDRSGVRHGKAILMSKDPSDITWDAVDAASVGAPTPALTPVPKPDLKLVPSLPDPKHEPAQPTTTWLAGRRDYNIPAMPTSASLFAFRDDDGHYLHTSSGFLCWVSGDSKGGVKASAGTHKHNRAGYTTVRLAPVDLYRLNGIVPPSAS